MIVDIDNSESVRDVVNKITENWFNPDKMYFDLKNNGKITTNFWNITDYLLDNISEYLDRKSEEFLNIWNQKCSTYGVKIMGYHCTRHSNKNVFTEKGILPLSDKTIKICGIQNQNIEAKEMWEYRSQRTPGPCFFLSYKNARNPSNHYHSNGPEILLACTGCQTTAESTKSIPLIIHCAIPYSILPDKNYYAFCILRAYFNFIDPDDDLYVEGYSIDLKGNKLDPEHIINIEEIKNII